MKITQDWINDFTESMKNLESIADMTKEPLYYMETDSGTVLSLVKELRESVHYMAKAQYDLMYYIYRKENWNKEGVCSNE